MNEKVQSDGVRRHREDLARVTASLCDSGFDLLHLFSVRQANADLEAEHRLPELEQRDALGLFIANSRELWGRFVPKADSSAAHPLDTYVVERIGAALTCWKTAYWTGFSHVTEPTPLAMQRIARAAGFLELGPAHLSVHPRVGPWCALRAVVVFAEPAQDHRLSSSEPFPCPDCEAPCVARIDAALAGRPHPAASEVSPQKAPWLAVRDACPVGRLHRYSAEQLRYHYDQDVEALYGRQKTSEPGPMSPTRPGTSPENERRS